MTSGPPPYAAESSGFRISESPTPSTSATPQPPVHPSQPQHPSRTPYQTHSGLAAAVNQSYYGYNAWQSSWTSYPYGSTPGTGYPTTPFAQAPNYSTLPYQHSITPSPTPVSLQPSIENKPSPKPVSPPPPPPVTYRHWDEILRSFFSAVGLTQTLRGFEVDMLILNPEFEKEKVQPALKELLRKLTKARELDTNEAPEDFPARSLEERKVDYVHLPGGVKPQSQTSINKSISAFLANKRARNDASNRTEFVHSIEEKRRKLAEDSGVEPRAISSCARTDAKPIDRDTQMKYDIAKNEEAPLRRTMKTEDGEFSNDKGKRPPDMQEDKAVPAVDASLSRDESVTASQYPAINERLGDIESHLAIRYVPSTPRTLFARLKFLEDHIIKLEKEYPPWAALHFNQPGRGWPPPPRQTPVIVPPHLRATVKDALASAPAQMSVVAQRSVPGPKEMKSKKSSLHKAVMDKLEVQQAMNELRLMKEQDIKQDFSEPSGNDSTSQR